MEILFVLACGIVGLLAGIAINQLADDLPERRAVTALRCPHCHAPRPMAAQSIAWAWLIRLRRCPACDRPWEVRAVAVELLTAAAYAALAIHFGPTWILPLSAFYVAIFILVTVVDLEHRRILNAVMFPMIAFALLVSPIAPLVVFPSWSGVGSALAGGLVGFGFFFLAAKLGSAAFGRGALGDGDITLATFVGLITGFPVAIIALIVTVMSGGVISSLLVASRVRSIKSFIPYGPFIILGGVVALFWGPAIMAWYLSGR